jgi:hypothetical protein
MVSVHLPRRWNSSVCISVIGQGFKDIRFQVMHILTNPSAQSYPFVRISEYSLPPVAKPWCCLCTDNLCF